MMRKSFLAALAMFSGSACSATSPSTLDGRSPYGIWVTEKGHVIVITRDKHYTYCGRESCTQGAVETVGAFGVSLKGFLVDPATKGLRVEAGEDELSAVAGKTASDFDFTQKGSGMSDDLRKSLCGNRPCVTVGNLESNVHRFIKIEDF